MLHQLVPRGGGGGVLEILDQFGRILWTKMWDTGRAVRIPSNPNPTNPNPSVTNPNPGASLESESYESESVGHESESESWPRIRIPNLLPRIQNFASRIHFSASRIQKFADISGTAQPI